MEIRCNDIVRIETGEWSGYFGRVKRIGVSARGRPLYFVRVADRCGEYQDASYYDNEITVIKGVENSENGTAENQGAKVKTEYQKAIEDLMDRQKDKGMTKYGMALEDNDTLTTGQRIEHLEEELIDGLMYCEHLKKAVGGGASLTADDYQRAALRTAQTDIMGRDELLLNGVMGLCGEAGECIELIKKAKFQGHEIDSAEMMYELGDVAWYLAVTAYAMGFDLSEVLEQNIQKLKDRYPDRFDKARSIGRKEYRENSDADDQNADDD